MSLIEQTKFQQAVQTRGLVAALIAMSEVKLPGMPNGTTYRVSIPMNLVVPLYTDRDLRGVLRVLDSDYHQLDPNLRYDSFVYLGCGSATIGLEDTEETEPHEIGDLFDDPEGDPDLWIAEPYDAGSPPDLARYTKEDYWPSDGLVIETIAECANKTIDRWESGDLAQAVNDLREALVGAGLRK